MPVTTPRKACLIAIFCSLFVSFATSSASGAELENSFLLETNGSTEPSQKFVFMGLELGSKANASRFHLEARPDGRVCLKFIDFASYLSASDDRQTIEFAEHCLDWEAFQVERLNDGFVAFKSHHGTYLRAHFEKKHLDQAEHIGEWERFKQAKFTNINGFGEGLFIPLTPLQKIADTQSWIYMPMILASLQALGIQNERHIPNEAVAADREHFERNIPGFFKFMTDMLSFNIRRKLQEGASLSFEEGILSIGEATFIFDNTKHMKGEDQERFLNAFSNTFGVDINAFLGEYPQFPRNESIWMNQGGSYIPTYPEQLVRSLFDTAQIFDFPEAEVPYLAATLNSIIQATAF